MPASFSAFLMPPATRLTTDSIEDLLLDQVLPAAYAPRPGEPPPRYDVQVAARALSYIAARMNQDSTRNLAWWHIHAWTARSVQVIVTGLVTGLVFGLVAGLAAGLVFGLVFGLGAGLVFGIVFALAAGRRRGSRSPERVVPLRRQSVGLRHMGSERSFVRACVRAGRHAAIRICGRASPSSSWAGWCLASCSVSCSGSPSPLRARLVPSARVPSGSRAGDGGLVPGSRAG